MAHYEIEFPKQYSFGYAGGPRHSTTVVVTKSGHEQRNINWSTPRREFDVSHNFATIESIDDLLAFVHVLKGGGSTLRFFDVLDHKSTRSNLAVTFSDQLIGSGTGAQSNYQFTKVYSIGAGVIGATDTRTITKIISGTGLVSITRAGSTFQVVSGVTIHENSGTAVFATAPPSGDTIRAGFEFHVPVRLLTDVHQFVAQTDDARSFPDVKLIEVRL